MAKHSIRLLSAIAMLTLAVSCVNDDTDFSAYTNGSSDDEATVSSVINTIYITYSGTSVAVEGDNMGYVTADGANVVVNTGTDTDSLLLVLSGSTTNGSLLIYRQRKFGMQLNGISINNPYGPAINNQCGKSLYMEVVNGTTNTLTDGSSYTEQEYDQKGALFCEGPIYFSGTGILNVTGSYKHAIASDDYIVFDKATVTASSSAGNGIKVNDGMWINGGTLDISTTAGAGRGIKCDSIVVITGGNTAITTSGDCVYDDTEQDYSSAACIKCEYPFSMSGGTLTMTSIGDGGKGINCAADIVFSGGTLTATTTGGNTNGKPKAIKSDTGIIVSGGSFTATVNKSWACDNGYGDDTTTDDEKLANCITVEGSPTSSSITKKSVIITYE